MNSRRSLLVLLGLLAVCGATISLGNGVFRPKEQTGPIQSAGKELSVPDFEVIELPSRAEFRRILLQYSSQYEGHDEQWEYLSAGSASKDPLDKDGLDENGLPDHPWLMIYKIRREKVPKSWLLTVIQEKNARLKEQRLRVIPGQLASVKQYEEWLQRTKARVDKDVRKLMEEPSDK